MKHRKKIRGIAGWIETLTPKEIEECCKATAEKYFGLLLKGHVRKPDRKRAAPGSSSA